MDKLARFADGLNEIAEHFMSSALRVVAFIMLLSSLYSGWVSINPVKSAGYFAMFLLAMIAVYVAEIARNTRKGK